MSKQTLLMRFRLVGGTHTQWDPKYAPLKDAEVRARVEELVKDEVGFPKDFDKLGQVEQRRWADTLADALKPCVLDRHTMLLKLGAEQRFVPGQVIESTEDLAARFVNKFQRLSGAEIPDELLKLREENEQLKKMLAEREQEKDEVDELETLDVPALRKYANDKGVPLGSAKSKAELIAVVREKMLVPA